MTKSYLQWGRFWSCRIPQLSRDTKGIWYRIYSKYWWSKKYRTILKRRSADIFKEKHTSSCLIVSKTQISEDQDCIRGYPQDPVVRNNINQLKLIQSFWCNREILEGSLILDLEDIQLIKFTKSGFWDSQNVFSSTPLARLPTTHRWKLSEQTCHAALCMESTGHCRNRNSIFWTKSHPTV